MRVMSPLLRWWLAASSRRHQGCEAALHHVPRSDRDPYRIADAGKTRQRANTYSAALEPARSRDAIVDGHEHEIGRRFQRRDSLTPELGTETRPIGDGVADAFAHPASVSGQRGDRSTLRQRVHLVWAARLQHFRDQFGRANPVTHAKPGESKGLGHRPRYEDRTTARSQRGEVVATEFRIRLIDDHESARVFYNLLDHSARQRSAG